MAALSRRALLLAVRGSLSSAYLSSYGVMAPSSGHNCYPCGHSQKFHTASHKLSNKLDFKSNDLLCFTKSKNDEALNHARDHKASLYKLEANLQLLYGKPQALLTEESANICCERLAVSLNTLDVVTYGIERRFDNSSFIKEKLVSRYDDLRKLLKTTIDRNYVIYFELGSTSESLRDLKRICELAKTSGSDVFCSDPHGTALMRHITGDARDSLMILRRPVYIHTSLNIISPEAPVFALAGDSITGTCPSQNNVTSDLLLQRLKDLPYKSRAAIRAIGHLMQLYSRLSDLELKSEMDGYQVNIKVEKPLKIENVVQRLTRCYVDVNVKRDLSGDYVNITVPSHHSSSSINQLVWAVARSFGVKYEPEKVSNQKASTARLSKGKIYELDEKFCVTHSAKDRFKHSRVTGCEVAPPAGEDWSLLESVYSWDSYREIESPLFWGALDKNLT